MKPIWFTSFVLLFYIACTNKISTPFTSESEIFIGKVVYFSDSASFANIFFRIAKKDNEPYLDPFYFTNHKIRISSKERRITFWFDHEDRLEMDYKIFARKKQVVIKFVKSDGSNLSILPPYRSYRIETVKIDRESLIIKFFDQNDESMRYKNVPLKKEFYILLKK